MSIFQGVLGLAVLCAFLILSFVVLSRSLREALFLTSFAVVLSLIHADLTADDALRRLGYPLIAAVAGSALLALLWHRFRQRIRRTRAERWRDRTSGGSACGGSPR